MYFCMKETAACCSELDWLSSKAMVSVPKMDILSSAPAFTRI